MSVISVGNTLYPKHPQFSSEDNKKAVSCSPCHGESQAEHLTTGRYFHHQPEDEGRRQGHSTVPSLMLAGQPIQTLLAGGLQSLRSGWTDKETALSLFNFSFNEAVQEFVSVTMREYIQYSNSSLNHLSK